jgi:Ca2+:H+ antiporter
LIETSESAIEETGEMPSGIVATIKQNLALIVAIVTAIIMYTVGKNWLTDLSNPVVFVGLFVWLFAVMVWAAFLAVRHADSLAEMLGEPYGTLILTLSVICIEVSVIAAVMLAGHSSPTLPRDTMLAVLMIVLNGMVGICLLIGGRRYQQQDYNLQGARTFLSVLITLVTITLILPTFTVSTDDPSLTPHQAILFSAATIVLYGAFLAIQTMRHRSFFMEPGLVAEDMIAQDIAPEHGKHPEGLETRSLAYHALFLLATLVMIVLLSKKFGTLVDEAIEILQAPKALGGIVIALLVLAPEALAAFRAAAANHLQRAVNICLGSALATISLTVPAVLLIALFTGTHLILGLERAELIMITLTLVISIMTFSGPRTNVLQGVVLLTIFAVYMILIFDP